MCQCLNAMNTYQWGQAILFSIPKTCGRHQQGGSIRSLQQQSEFTQTVSTRQLLATRILGALLPVSVCCTLPINVCHKILKLSSPFFAIFMDMTPLFILFERMPTPLTFQLKKKGATVYLPGTSHMKKTKIADIQYKVFSTVTAFVSERHRKAVADLEPANAE